MRSGRSGSLSCWALVGFLFWAGCTDKNQPASAPPADTWDGYCIDQDGDGRGFQCADGDDCNDEDPAIFEGCKPCTTPNEGCACEANAAPRECVVSKEIVEGSLLCKSGTRYCRDSKWSACEGVKTFEAPPPSHLLARSLIDPDAGAVACSECHPDCYQIEDTLSADASYGDSGIVPGYNGGITLNSYRDDSGVADYDAGTLDDKVCNPDAGYDRDCDGIPDEFDPFPGAAPFSSQHNTIFMDLGPGDVAEESFSVHFFLNTADIYLYLDMTGSMNGERTNLLASLRNGSYMPADRVNEPCADSNLNGSSTDEEYLKDAGIAGNLACLIRDSHFGAGWHRDLPFPRADPSGFAFGPHDFEVFQHEQDLTGDLTAVLAGLNRFGTRGGINRPEGGIMGLYALATGAQLYLGWDRPGNPARTGCPAGTWGYACFRDEAVPIVIWMTDAPITNGPAPAENKFENDSPATGYTSAFGSGARAQPVNWDPSALVIETGTGSTYNTIGTTHETFATAYDLGDINSSFKTYVFDSTGMRSDITYASLTGSSSASYVPATSVCGSGTASAWSTTQTAPDAVFKIRVTESEPITISTRGSRVQGAIAIVDADRIDNATLTTAVVANSQPSTPASIATPLTFPGVANIAGSTVSATASFGRDAVGCLASGSIDKIGGSVVKFNLAADAANVRFVNDSGYPASTTLFAGRPGIYTAADVALGSLVVTEGTATKTGNSNDKMNSYNIGNMTGVYKRFTGGDSSGTGATGSTGQYLSATYSAGMFNGVDGCSGAAGTSKDAVFDFSISTATHLRIDGTGMNASLTAGFDHMIGLVSRGVVTPVTGITGNVTDSGTTPYTIPFTSLSTMGEYSWLQFNGSSGGTTAQLYLQAETGPFTSSTSTTACTNAAAAASASMQAVFVLDIPTGTPSRSYDFDTGGSAVNTWLSLHKTSVRPSYGAATAANTTNSIGTSATVVAQPLGALDEASVFVTGGSLTNTATAKLANSAFGTSCGSTNGKDAVYTFTVAQTQQIQITTGSSTGTAPAANNPSFDSYVGVFAGSLSGTRVAGGCDNQTGVINAAGGSAQGNAYETAAFTASPGITYYVVVKNFATTTSTVSYGLWLRDTTFWSKTFQGCDYGSQPYASSVRSAKLTRTLGPGKYFVVVKTTGSGTGAYQLNVRRTPTGEPTLMACDRDGGGSQHSYIDQTLQPGNYSLILRGVADSASGTTTTGAYNVIFRDLGVAPMHIACGYDANTSSVNPTPFTASNLAARDGSGNLIDYYLVMRGNTTSGTSTTGFYNMRIEDASSMATTQCAFDNVTMTYSQVAPLPAYTASTDINNAEWTGTLPLGDYYVVLKGYNASDTLTDSEDNDWGQWQFSVGDQAHYEGTGTFDAKRWLGPTGDGAGGILEAVKARKLRVIMVDSTDSPGDNDHYSDQQMRAIASATDAVALDGTPLFYKINENGTGLGTAIVQSINTLAGNLAMDVGVRLVELPDSPAPKHFNFRAEAIDVDGDSCSPPVDADGDSQHIVDTHTKCRPGATPLFKITLSNPNPPYNVPTNRNDPGGGWNMRIDLIADGQYVVDQIPVYIIPDDVRPQPGDKVYDAIGTYQDTVPATGCVGNEAPFWEALQWAGSVPGGTSLAWNICTADTAAQLDSCAFQRAVTVTTTNGCVTSADCAEGFCNPDINLCEVRRGPACANDSDCRSPNVQGGVCAIPAGTMLPKACLWNGDVTVTPVLSAGQQGKRYARVQAVMESNAAHTRAPTVNSWQLKYTCSAQE